MAKGPKLKDVLDYEKAKQNIAKEENLKKEKKFKELEANQPVVITKDDLINSGLMNQDKPIVDDIIDEEIKALEGKTLSKKQKRQLAKLQKKKEQMNEASAEPESENENEPELDIENLAASDDSESEDDDSESEDDDSESQDDQSEEEGEESEEEDEDEDKPREKVFANNQKALKKAYNRLRLPWETTRFVEHQTLTTSAPIHTLVENIEDDTQRELAFYKASLEATSIAKKKLLQQKVPFHRPLDYFAEMLKTDDHMEKLKQRLIQEESEKLARQEARRQRNLKKFGKQVQIQTMQKRQQEKKDTLDKIKSLKKKRGANEISGGSEFDIAVEDAIDGKDNNKRQKVNHKREGKNKKFGQGGMKRFKRKNDAQSSSGIPDKKFNKKGKKRF